MNDAGTRSDNSPATPPWDPPTSREAIRLTMVYATDLHHPLDAADLGRPLGEVLRLGRLADFYARSADQLPHIVSRTEIHPADLAFQRWQGTLQAAAFWLVVLPSERVLVTLSLDVASDLLGTIPLLEDLYYADVTVTGVRLSAWATAHQMPSTDEPPSEGCLLPERHQLIFASIPDETAAPTRDVLQRLIYRADIPSRPGSDAIRIPAELNRRPTSIAAVGSYVSVIAGHQEYVENTAFLSAAQVVGSAAQLREIRERAYECVRDFRQNRDEAFPVRRRRLTFERIAAELASVSSIENRADDARRTRTVGAVTFISTIAGTLPYCSASSGSTPPRSTTACPCSITGTCRSTSSSS